MKKNKRLPKKLPTIAKAGLLTHVTKQLNEAENKGLNMSDLIKIMQESKDVRDKVLGDMVNKLFDKESLLAISILDLDMMYHVLRHLLVLNYYVERWNGLSVEVTITPSPERYPYYTIDTKYIGNLDIKQATSYKRFIDELLLIRVSLKGQGRMDIKDIVKGAEQRMIQSDMVQDKKAGFMSKFM